MKCDIGSWVIDESSPAYYFSRDFHSHCVILDDESKWTWEKSGKLPPVYFPISCEKYIHNCSKGVLSCSKKKSLLLHAATNYQFLAAKGSYHAARIIFSAAILQQLYFLLHFMNVSFGCVDWLRFHVRKERSHFQRSDEMIHENNFWS